MIISSRTPEGTPNRCPVCNYRCWVVPSKRSRDAPCPRCGHLLWFDSTDAQQEKAAGHVKQILKEYEHAPQPQPSYRKTPELTPAELAALANRPKRLQNAPKSRKPQVQAARLVRRLVRRGVDRFGQPNTEVAIELASIAEPRQAERLLSLLSTSQS